MKKLYLYIGVFFSGFCIAATASATTTTFVFDPNDWVTNYSTDTTQTRIQQTAPRLLIDGVSQSTDAAGSPGTHTTYAGAGYSSSGISGFANQVAGVEIHDFNMWLADGINAPNWGEVLTQVSGSTPSGTAGNGWAAYTFANPWPQPGSGSVLVGWYDIGYYDGDLNTAAHPLTFGNGGIDFAPFTLTVDVNNTDVNGNPVNFSGIQTIWFGTMLPTAWTADPAELVYAGNRRFEGTMQLAPVPIPGALVLFGSGLLGLVGIGRKRLKG